MKKLTQEEYINLVKQKHGETKYDYSSINYINISTKINIICNIDNHGVFEQTAKNHKDGQGCPKCVGRGRTIEEVIKICKEKHNYKYDYSLITSNLTQKYIDVIEIKTGLIFRQTLHNHLTGQKPIKITTESLISRLKEIHNNEFSYLIDKEVVGNSEIINIVDNKSGDVFQYAIDNHLNGAKPNRITLNRFLIKSKEVHNNKYDYSLVKDITGINNIVNITCPKHGVFTQKVNNHMNLKDGCPKCVGRGLRTTESMIEDFKKIHFDKYDYSLVVYKANGKVDIICKEHGIFKQNIYKHLLGQGCKQCSSNSIGEEYIKIYLEKNKIKYINQHGFDTYKYINKLNFYFYLPKLDVLIEYDGLQHFEPVKDFGGIEAFKLGLKRDEAKNKWCV